MRVGTSAEVARFFKSDYGSSPCVWGQASSASRLFIRIRIIPMRVGTSCHLIVPSLHHQDHPHACGDKKRERYPRFYGLGSSPCVWGQEHTFAVRQI